MFCFPFIHILWNEIYLTLHVGEYLANVLKDFPSMASRYTIHVLRFVMEKTPSRKAWDASGSRRVQNAVSSFSTCIQNESVVALVISTCGTMSSINIHMSHTRIIIISFDMLNYCLSVCSIYNWNLIILYKLHISIYHL